MAMTPQDHAKIAYGSFAAYVQLVANLAANLPDKRDDILEIGHQWLVGYSRTIIDCGLTEEDLAQLLYKAFVTCQPYMPAEIFRLMASEFFDEEMGESS